MNRLILGVTALIVVNGAFVQAQHGYYGGMPGAQMARARLGDDKKSVVIRMQHTFGFQQQEITYRTKTDKGDFDKSATIGLQTFEEVITTIPANVLRLLGADGRPLPAEKLAEQLASEKPIVVVSGEVNAAELQVFKPGILIVQSPIPLGGFGAPYGPPPDVVPVPAPPKGAPPGNGS